MRIQFPRSSAAKRERERASLSFLFHLPFPFPLTLTFSLTHCNAIHRNNRIYKTFDEMALVLSLTHSPGYAAAAAVAFSLSPLASCHSLPSSLPLTHYSHCNIDPRAVLLLLHFYVQQDTSLMNFDLEHQRLPAAAVTVTSRRRHERVAARTPE